MHLASALRSLQVVSLLKVQRSSHMVSKDYVGSFPSLMSTLKWSVRPGRHAPHDNAFHLSTLMILHPHLLRLGPQRDLDE